MFAIRTDMDSVALALRARFDEICRAELHRLQRKTSSLPAAQREEVHAIAAIVVAAIARRAAAALRQEHSPDLTDAVDHLFGISAAH